MNYNDKQLQIIETAEKLFGDKGFEGTSVRDMAEAAGVNVAMISYYFGSKEKLLEALFEVKIGRVQVRVENLLKDDSLTPMQKMNVLIEEHVERVVTSHQFYKVMVCELVTNSTPAIKEKVKQLKIKNVELISQLIKDGQKKGDFKKNLDVILMLNTMMGTTWQTIISKDMYKDFDKNASLTEEEYTTQLYQKLTNHIKKLFKAILTHEA